ncbi:hypothetical protein AAFF_G00187650 [Aldrovandia affinis]|uniref:Uncharacterized protein n=1 Tax=Aldrovandia affinis TaxID=143900 RepID=A0AAD7SYR4_9TELE|nr:hypothetical protein AAFF_G00187650 [Aldrovandia affinis]
MTMGQGLSVLICGTAVSSQYLAVDFHVNTPMLQSFMSYILLCLMYTSMLAFRKARNVLLGDGLVLISATLYAISNVCQEYTVKNCSRVEFLGMVGLFGTLISTIQLCMPVVVKLSSATAVNLSLLTADLFSLFCGLFLFQYAFSGLYIVSFVVITVGFFMFNAVPTFTLATTPTQASNGGLANPASDTDGDLKQEMEVDFPLEVEERKVEKQEKEETAKCEHLDGPWTSQVQNRLAQTAEYSTKM